MPVYKDTPNNRKLGRVGKELGDPKYVVSKSAPKKKASVPKKPAYDTDPNFFNTEHGKKVMGMIDLTPAKPGGKLYPKAPAGKHYMPDGKLMKNSDMKKAPAKKQPVKKAGGTKKPSKPALDIDTFLDAMSIMGTVAKVPGKVNKTDFIVALNKKKGRPSFSLFQDILMDNDKFLEDREESEKGNMDIQINNLLSAKNRTLEELTTNQQEKLQELVMAKASKTEAEYLKNTYNSRVKGVKEKRFSYADIIKIGRDMYD